MTGKEAPSWLTPDLRARWDAHEAAARDRAERARRAYVRKRLWAGCYTAVAAYPLLVFLGLAMGVPKTWEGAGFALCTALAAGFGVALQGAGPEREAEDMRAKEPGELPRTVPLVPPNQGSARMRPDDGGWR